MMRKVYSDYISAYNHLAHEQYSEASEILLKINTIVPGEEKILRKLCTSLVVLKDFEKAEIYLLQLTKISSLTIDEFINLGYIQSTSGKQELAIENYQKALKIDPNNLFALNNLGYEYIFNRKYDEGEKLLTKAIQIDPEFAYSYNNLGYIKLLTGYLEEGKQLIEKSIEMAPENAYGYKHLGVCYLKIHDKGQAKINFQKALELDPLVVMENYLTEIENPKENTD
jgi:tetratricopeptide (TPR) repeat protein